MAITYALPEELSRRTSCAEFLLAGGRGRRGHSQFLFTEIVASAVEPLNQIARSVATNARSTQSVGRAQVFVIKANS
jgi:hypothetical protein